MKHLPLVLALAASLALPALAQQAPAGWKTQTRAQNATTYTPPDLKTGEVYSVTIYDAVPLNGKSLDAFLRTFAGAVGTKTGQLAAPLQMGQGSAQNAVGTGVYQGPNGTQLVAVFNVFSLDSGQTVSVSRVLASGDALILRHQNEYVSLVKAMVARARNEVPQNEAPQNSVPVPDPVLQHLKPGGALVPGIYAGNQFSGDKLDSRLRLYIYPSGEYQFKNEKDEDFRNSAGTAGYTPATGQLNLDIGFNMIVGTGSSADDNFCFYGRNSAGKPAIYAEYDLGFHTARTSLIWVAPLAASTSPKEIKAREAAKKAEAARFKFVTAPNRGVKAAQIQAVVHRYEYDFGSMDFLDEAFLLLRDGTVHLGLPCSPDQLDVAASRRGEPKAWGRWRKTAKGYQVSWAGGAWKELPGTVAFPGPAQTRLEGRWAAVRATMYSHQFWGVTFGKDGRFSKDSRGGVTTGNIPMEGGLTPRVDSTWDDGGSGTIISGGVGGATVKKGNPKGDRQGTYSIDGYTLTLRYDNGRIARLPFFFRDAKRRKLWFESNTLELGLDD